MFDGCQRLCVFAYLPTNRLNLASAERSEKPRHVRFCSKLQAVTVTFTPGCHHHVTCKHSLLTLPSFHPDTVNLNVSTAATSRPRFESIGEDTGFEWKYCDTDFEVRLRYSRMVGMFPQSILREGLLTSLS